MITVLTRRGADRDTKERWPCEDKERLILDYHKPRDVLHYRELEEAKMYHVLEASEGSQLFLHLGFGLLTAPTVRR